MLSCNSRIRQSHILLNHPIRYLPTLVNLNKYVSKREPIIANENPIHGRA